MQRLAVSENELPLVVCPNGLIYRRPTVAELALCRLGLVPDIAPAPSMMSRSWAAAR